MSALGDTIGQAGAAYRAGIGQSQQGFQNALGNFLQTLSNLQRQRETQTERQREDDYRQTLLGQREKEQTEAIRQWTAEHDLRRDESTWRQTYPPYSSQAYRDDQVHRQMAESDAAEGLFKADNFRGKLSEPEIKFFDRYNQQVRREGEERFKTHKQAADSFNRLAKLETKDIPETEIEAEKWLWIRGGKDDQKVRDARKQLKDFREEAESLRGLTKALDKETMKGIRYNPATRGFEPLPLPWKDEGRQLPGAQRQGAGMFQNIIGALSRLGTPTAAPAAGQVPAAVAPGQPEMNVPGAVNRGAPRLNPWLGARWDMPRQGYGPDASVANLLSGLRAADAPAQGPALPGLGGSMTAGQPAWMPYSVDDRQMSEAIANERNAFANRVKFLEQQGMTREEAVAEAFKYFPDFKL